MYIKLTTMRTRSELLASSFFIKLYSTIPYS